MQIKKRLSALFLSVAMSFLCIPSFAIAAVDEWDAEGQLGATMKTENLSIYNTDSKTACTTGEKAGRGGHLIQLMDWARYALSVNVMDTIKPAGGQNVYVEVDYYDETEGGAINIVYNTLTEKNKVTEFVVCKGEGNWKTAGFVLYAPSFKNDTYLGDFAITGGTKAFQSICDMLIGAVRVKLIDQVAPASVTIDFSKNPKNYYEGEQLQYTVNYENILSEAYDLDVKIEIVNSYNEVVGEYEDKISLKSKETLSKTYTPDFEVFGRHILKVTVTNEELGYESYGRNEFSYSVKSDFMNYRFGTIAHLGFCMDDRDPNIIYPMMKNAGIGWNRDEIRWQEFEQQVGVYDLLSYHEEMLDGAIENDIKLLVILGGGNEIYASGGSNNTDPWAKSYPTTEAGYEAFGNYVYNMIKQVDGRTTYFEYWNEFGWGGTDLDLYAPFAKCMYDAVKRADPTARTVGICSAGTGVELIQLCFPLGAEHWMDDVSYHNYTKGDPVTSGVLDNSVNVRNTLNKFETGKDKKIWLTEMGATTATTTYNNQAVYILKETAIHLQKDLVEAMFVYDFTDDGAQRDKEKNFGLTDNFAKTNPNRFLAKPSYVTIAAMNDKLGTPEHVKTMKLRDNNVHVYQYKRTEDDKDVVIAWSQQENEFINLDFGAEVEIFDSFGNPLDIDGENGNYPLLLGNRPIIIVGDFEEVKEGKMSVYFSETSLISPVKDKATITIYKSNTEPATVEIGELPEDSTIKVLNTPKFNGKIAQIKLELDGFIGKIDELPVKVTTESGRVCYDGTIRVQYQKGLEISGRSHLYRDNDPKRWKLALDIVSHYREKDLAATLDIISPEVIAQKNIKLGTLVKGENHVEFHVNKLKQFSSYSLQARIKLENGYEEIVSFPIDFAVAYKAKKVPTIDGVLEEGEWDERGEIVTNLEEQWYVLDASIPWKGPDDVSSRSWTEWDEDNLYMAWEVTDDIHWNPYSDGNMWRADCIQIAITFIRFQASVDMPEGAPASAFNEIGFALDNNGQANKYRYSVENGAPFSLDNTELAIKRVGNKTVYEVSIGWEDIMPPGVEIKENMEISYAFLVNENDNDNRSGGMMFGDGIMDTPKSVAKTARIRLMSESLN